MVKNSQRKLMKNKNKILGAYSEHYRLLLRIKEGNTEAEKAAESKVERQFESNIRERTTLRKTRNLQRLSKKAIKLMRNKRSADRQGWRAEWIKMGDEMIDSLVICLIGWRLKAQYRTNGISYLIEVFTKRFSWRTLIIKEEFSL